MLLCVCVHCGWKRVKVNQMVYQRESSIPLSANCTQLLNKGNKKCHLEAIWSGLKLWHSVHFSCPWAPNVSEVKMSSEGERITGLKGKIVLALSVSCLSSV